MLYHVVDAQYAALGPARLTAAFWRGMFSHPYFPSAYTPVGRAAAAACELFERATSRFDKPKFGLNHTILHGRTMAVTERVISSKPFCSLIHFARDRAPPQPRILLVAPLSGHHATLLRGTVEALLPDHDVYMTDWTDARMAPLEWGQFDIHDYIDYLICFLRMLGPETHVMAVCQPSPLVLAAVALMAAAGDPAQPRSMTLMGGPIDTRINPTAVNALASSRPLDWFARTVVTSVPPWHAGHGRSVYPGFLQLTGFMSMNLDRHVRAHFDLFQHLVEGDGDGAAEHRRFYDEYLSVMDLPAEFYLQSIAAVFQDHALPRGLLRHRDQKVEPAAIERTALMTVEGEKDDISGVGQTAAAHALMPALRADKRRHLVQAGVGHFGIFNGRRWRETIYPAIRDFIRAAD